MEHTCTPESSRSPIPCGWGTYCPAHRYESPYDVRPLVKITHPDPAGAGYDLALATSGFAIVKRFASEERRDEYLKRNRYTLKG